jgi:transcription antitermination factor NusG
MIPGVNSIVGIGKTPMPVDEQELDAIRSVMKSGVYCEPWPFLQVGQWVRVKHGAFAGMEGIVTAHKNAFRLVISLDLLQRSVALEIDGDCLTPISPPRTRSHVVVPA